ncbi:MAG TPA: GtrA family protein [Candidatus Avacidaminococcus intestinavium]|uniref:GtrA family protein n=1 Tax=Candidatus Avacidaminococcus intestinavium TaxID=2840684 RepID=A0A9D1MNY5_9FIRM|nr:GtrA family protein [Candidatus Avacidaminococcus intestinavium]
MLLFKELCRLNKLVLNNKFFLYLIIGAIAALIEWLTFYFLNQFLGLHYLVTTTVAFAFATLCHYVLGNIAVFTSGVRYGKTKELSLVFLVSSIGLVFNLLLMGLFVGIFFWPTLISKIIASFIVVFWNYSARKKWIF